MESLSGNPFTLINLHPSLKASQHYPPPMYFSQMDWWKLGRIIFPKCKRVVQKFCTKIQQHIFSTPLWLVIIVQWGQWMCYIENIPKYFSLRVYGYDYEGSLVCKNKKCSTSTLQKITERSAKLFISDNVQTIDFGHIIMIQRRDWHCIIQGKRCDMCIYRFTPDYKWCSTLHSQQYILIAT